MSQSINRRQVLMTAAATGGASLCQTLRLPAAEGMGDLSFVIVSDTHLGRKDNKIAEKNWRQAMEEINDQSGEFVLHLGDVVDGGRKEQYPIYAETRKLLKKPIHEIPGNHDPVDHFKKHIAKETDRVVEYGGVRFILFNNSHRDSHDGFITSKQLQWLEKSFKDATDKSRRIVVCCHVPIHENKHPDRGWYVKPKDGQGEFYKLLAEYSKSVLTILHGHFHNGIRGWRDHGQTVETLVPSVCYNQNRGLAKQIASGNATGFFVDELRPGYVLATIGQGRLTLRYKPLGAITKAKYEAKWS